MLRLTSRVGFLRTRVARQTLGHFLSAALLPALVSSLLGIWYVRRTLTTEASERVDRTAESAAQMILRELTTLASETKVLAPQSLTTATDVQLSESETAHLARGGVALRIDMEAAVASAGTEVATPFRLIRRAPDGGLGARPVRASDIWAPLEQLIDGDRTELCVFVLASLERLHCSDTVTGAREAELREVARGAGSPDGATLAEEADLLVARRDLYLRYELASPEWRLVTAEQRATALAPASSVTTSLAILIALAAVGAFALAHRQIRHDTMPLDALHAATRRVAAGDLQTPVVIDSSDEYGELGVAFNRMTGTLSQQLTLLQIMDDVDDATLRERNLEAIVSIALVGLRRAHGLQRATVALVDEYSTTAVSRWTCDASIGRMIRSSSRFTADERARMFDNPRLYMPSADSVGGSASQGWLPSGGESSRLILPLIADDELLGAIALDFADQRITRGDESQVARRIADRVALGVANVRTLDRLDALSSGTLLAFARAIDANSPWTAGHSERVTQLAISLGRQLGLAQSELEILYRGGLMHDIGKIGIPPQVLDKAGRLDDDERALIEKHPEIGERILRPIPAFADALSIVRSHHERIDGTGYPDRLAGDAIPWLARILAVADVFDALASDRPYRAGLSHRAVITMIEGNSGTHFDPRVVEALLALEQHTPSALARQGSLHELSMRGGSLYSTPHTDMAAVA